MIELLFLTLNRLDKTVMCFETLAMTLSQRGDVVCRILDNGSTDPHVLAYLARLSKAWPGRVIVEFSPTNLGVAGGRQRLWEQSQSSLVVFLDSDVVFPTTAAWLSQLERSMQDAEVGAAGPDGGIVSRDWTKFKHTDSAGDCDVICGFCTITRTALREQGVRFDLQYNPYWHEDSDFCMQVQAAGYRVRKLGDIGLVHAWGKQNAEIADERKKMTYFRKKWEGRDLALIEQQRIPNDFHFCFGFADTAQPFLFAHYMAVKSAVLVNQPDNVTIYYGTAPTGVWWKRVAKYAKQVAVKPPTMYLGRQFIHFAHRADVFRLQTLQRVGGVYMDMDTLCLRPFHMLRKHNSMVMARQRGDEYGMCNATMLAEPAAPFLNAWLAEYRTFRSRGRDPYWDEHSVKRPLELAKRPELQGAITILPWTAFFYPDCHDKAALFSHSEVSPWDTAYSLHLWETISMAHVQKLTPDAVRRGTSAYCRLARPFLDDEV